jgi:ribosome-associated protein
LVSSSFPGSSEPCYPKGVPVIDTKTIAATVATILEEKKGLDIVVYDVADAIKVADYFVVVTGTSRPHVRAMYEDVRHRLKRLGETHSRPEGADLGWWVLLDYGDVVVHIQQDEARDYYGLDDLYGDCAKLDWQAIEVTDTGVLADA